MNNLDLNSYGVERLSDQQLKTVEGGMDYINYTGGNGLIYAMVAVRNAVAWVTNKVTGEKNPQVVQRS